MKFKIVYDLHGFRIWPDIPLAQREVTSARCSPSAEFYDPTGQATPTRCVCDLLDLAMSPGFADQMIACRRPTEQTLEITAAT